MMVSKRKRSFVEDELDPRQELGNMALDKRRTSPKLLGGTISVSRRLQPFDSVPP